MPFSPDTGKPRTAIRGRANPYGSGSVETPLSKHLLSQVPPAEETQSRATIADNGLQQPSALRLSPSDGGTSSGDAQGLQQPSALRLSPSDGGTSSGDAQGLQQPRALRVSPSDGGTSSGDAQGLQQPSALRMSPSDGGTSSGDAQVSLTSIWKPSIVTLLTSGGIFPTKEVAMSQMSVTNPEPAKYNLKKAFLVACTLPFAQKRFDHVQLVADFLVPFSLPFALNATPEKAFVVCIRNVLEVNGSLYASTCCTICGLISWNAHMAGNPAKNNFRFAIPCPPDPRRDLKSRQCQQFPLHPEPWMQVCQFRRGRRPEPRVSGRGQIPPKKASTYQAGTLPHSRFQHLLTLMEQQGPNLPRARLNHQDALFPRHGKATHSQTWAGEPAWLGVRGDATLQTPAFTGAPCGEITAPKRTRSVVCWDAFRAELEQTPVITPGGDPETRELAHLLRTIHEAKRSSTQHFQVAEDKPSPDLHLANLWQQRLDALCAYRERGRTPGLRRRLNLITAEARDYANTLSTDRWCDLCSSFNGNMSGPRIWHIFCNWQGKAKRRTAAQTTALRMRISEEQLALQAGAVFFPQPAASPDPTIYSRDSATPTQMIGDFQALDLQAPEQVSMDQPFQMGELHAALARANARSAPGPDLITISELRNLPELHLQLLLDAINEIWTTGNFPSSWRESLVMPIPKPGNPPNELTNLRPISLTSKLCKLTERIVLERLMWHLERNYPLHPHQLGFRHGMSAQDILLILRHQVLDAYSKVQTRTVVAVDVRNAFDTVPHEAVIQSAELTGLCGHPLNFVKSFLNDRTYKIKAGDYIGPAEPNRTGVPQGAALSPTLFNLVMARLPLLLEAAPSLHFAVYADNLNIQATISWVPAHAAIDGNEWAHSEARAAVRQMASAPNAFHNSAGEAVGPADPSVVKESAKQRRRRILRHFREEREERPDVCLRPVPPVPNDLPRSAQTLVRRLATNTVLSPRLRHKFFGDDPDEGACRRCRSAATAAHVV
ncbi:hypothetical protein ISCGN_019126 [Ixodes scapularis]